MILLVKKDNFGQNQKEAVFDSDFPIRQHRLSMKLLKKITWLLILLFIGCNGRAQNKVTIENLLNQLKAATSDSIKADLYNELCWNYRVEAPRLGFDYGEKALAIYVRQKNIVKQCNVLNKMGINKRNTGEYSKALDQFFRILKMAIKPSCNLEIAYANNNIADIYSHLEKYDKAIEFADVALPLFQSEKNNIGIAYNYNLRGTIYQNQRNWEMAARYFKQSLELRLLQKDEAGAASSFINIGDTYLEMNRPDSALANYNKGITYYDRAGFTNYGRGYISLGKYYAAKKAYPQAIRYLKEAIAKATLMKSPENILRANEALHRIYYQLKDYKKAYDIQAFTRTIDDTLRKSDYIKKITTFELNHAFEQQVKQKEIEDIRKNAQYESHLLKQKLFSVGLIVLLLGISILTFFIYRNYQFTRSTNRLLNEYNEEISRQKIAIQSQNDQLQELNATKDKFFNIIAHDLKNPFYGILGISEYIVSSYPESTYEETVNMVKMVRDSSESAYNLLENLLEWSKAQTGRLNYDPENFLLLSLAEEIDQLVKNLSEQKQIVIQYNIDPKLALMADRNMIHTILRNLITNAIKFTDKGGNIEIIATSDEKGVQITVKDNGIGISEESKAKLFILSEKVSSRGTANEKGTGLGLLLCKEFVEKHGGTIWVESESGKGSSFSFYLPFA